MEIKKGTRFVYYGELVEITDVTKELVYCRTLTRRYDEKILEDMGIREIIPYKDLEFYMVNQEARHAKAYYEAIEAEKQRKAEEEKAEAERREHERFNGFTDNMSPILKARVIKVLDKKILFSTGNKVMTWAQYVEEKVKEGATCECKYFTNRRTREMNKKPTYIIINENSTFIEVPKTVYEYFIYMGGIEK